MKNAGTMNICEVCDGYMFLFSLQDNESLEYRNSILFTFESHNVQDYHNVQI